MYLTYQVEEAIEILGSVLTGWLYAFIATVVAMSVLDIGDDFFIPVHAIVLGAAMLGVFAVRWVRRESKAQEQLLGQ